ncbi:DUF1707 SHOCT-like domain-containing protein [Marinactinospora thermotolerans]|nr:DUF1707 domain-containing protein [Marinactinospora thermotolerans]
MSEFSPETRASDSDRDRVAKQLQEHFAQGRLDDSEFTTRLEQVYQARTFGELVPLTADLPERDLADLPVVPEHVPAGRSAGSALRDPALLIPWLLWAGVNTLCLLIWLIAYLAGGGSDYPWFLWVAGPWGVVMAFITIGAIIARRGGDAP